MGVIYFSIKSLHPTEKQKKENKRKRETEKEWDRNKPREANERKEEGRKTKGHGPLEEDTASAVAEEES